METTNLIDHRRGSNKEIYDTIEDQDGTIRKDV